MTVDDLKRIAAPHPLNDDRVKTVLARIVGEARYGLRHNCSRQACQLIIKIVADEAEKFAAELSEK